MDDIDRAQEREMLDRDLAIAAARRAALPATGHCYNCEASVPPGVSFCDADCRADYERQADAWRRQGGKA